MMKPKARLVEIAQRLERVFSASTREEVIASVLDVGANAVHDIAFLLHREKGLRARLQTTLREKAELEVEKADLLTRVKQLEVGANEKTGIRAPLIRRPSQVVSEAALAELRELSSEYQHEQGKLISQLDSALNDAFFVDDEDIEDEDIETRP